MAVDRVFLLFTIGVVLTFSGVNGVVALVSSINIQDGLGTTSLAVAYGTSLVSAFVIPMLIERFGCRWIIATAELGFFFYVITNVYSSYNLVVGGLFCGWGVAGVWTAYAIVVSKFASDRSRNGSQTSSLYVNNYMGYFYTGVQVSFVIGNAAGFLILYIDRSLSNRLNITHVVNYSYCGANDCQSKNVTMLNIDQYTPVYVATRYIVVGVFSLLIIIAVILHLLFLPNDERTNNSVDIDLQSQDDGRYSDNLITSTQEESSCTTEVTEGKQVDGCVQLKTTIISSCRLYVKPKHLLILPLPIYNGLTLGFVLGEVTRAYGACVHGLDKVSIGGILFGTSDALLSFIAGKVAGKYGRNVPFGAAFVIDIVNYLVCLCWQITKQNSWLVFVLFFSFGMTDGIWQTLINVMYGEYFAEQKEIAMNIWNVNVNLGLMLQFTVSTLLCVYQKIYIQIAMLVIAVFFYTISQLLYYPTTHGEVRR